jgi:hypothetical protein
MGRKDYPLISWVPILVPGNSNSVLAPSYADALHASLKNILTYSPIMRFILTDEKRTEFRVERAGFADPDDEWLLLEAGNDLQKLAKKYCRHLGKDSLYDLL